MMQRDHGSDAALPQSAQHGAITFQRVLIPRIGRRLDPAPLHRHAMRVLSAFGGAVEVLFPAPAPPVTRQTGLPFGMTFLLPPPPIVVRVIAFHLICCCCRTP
jgi:hypothetical protein